MDVRTYKEMMSKTHQDLHVHDIGLLIAPLESNGYLRFLQKV